MPDTQTMTPNLYEGTYDLAAARERVWSALTDGSELKTGFAEHVEVEAARQARRSGWSSPSRAGRRE